ncbi:MAG: serine hydroxymethyltransferase [Candidatus Diapherotrites archaeon]|nr:serine hydroxymethyltransferase [Candidatus Diapherotrites archaeon]
MGKLRSLDPELAEAMGLELERQRQSIELIASENFVSVAVMEAMGSWLNNKYSEGYPGKRYYGGNQFIDMSENLAIERAKKLFNADHANVQPHAGSQANMEIYFATIKLGDKILSLDLPKGGHLTHGSPVNFSGQFYKIASYNLDSETEQIDMDHVRKRAEEEKPQLLLCGYTVYPRIVDFKEFGEIAKDVGAVAMADVAHIAGLIAGGAHPQPLPHMDVVMTTTHKTLRGPKGAMILCKEGLAKAVDKAVFPGLQGGPIENMIAAKAVAFGEALRPEFKDYAKQVVANAKVLAGEMMALGYRLVSGGTDNHLMLVDLQEKGVTGREAEQLLEKIDISVNRNMIPNDPQKPWVASGIRLGTPAMTTRGLKESEMKEIARLIDTAIANKGDEAKLASLKEEVHALTGKFPLYPEIDF